MLGCVSSVLTLSIVRRHSKHDDNVTKLCASCQLILLPSGCIIFSSGVSGSGQSGASQWHPLVIADPVLGLLTLGNCRGTWMVLTALVIMMRRKKRKSIRIWIITLFSMGLVFSKWVPVTYVISRDPSHDSGRQGVVVVQSLSHVQLFFHPMDCSPPGSSVHGICQNTGVCCHFLLQGIFPTQGSIPCLLLGRQILCHWTTREALGQVTKSLHVSGSSSLGKEGAINNVFNWYDHYECYLFIYLAASGLSCTRLDLSL